MIYLDYQATTPLAPEARAAMLGWLEGPEGAGFANPHSPHKAGRAAAAAVEHAREQVAALFPPGGRVIFTSGATEAINLAILGTAAAGRRAGLSVSAIEHAAVLDTAQASRETVSVLPASSSGLIDSETDVTPAGLVAVMQVNNEIGTIQRLAELAGAAHRAGALFLCDAVQGAGKIAPPKGADLIAASAHKLHGPKGIGALWVRDGVAIAPIQHGGGQEQGLRSGTLSPALCAGFGAAAALAVAQRDSDTRHVAALWREATAILSDWTINGDPDRRWHGNLNIRREGLDVARLMSDLRGIAFAAGSACASGSGRPSHVLSAIGLAPDQARSSVRLGFGRYTSIHDLRLAAEAIDDAARAQRR